MSNKEKTIIATGAILSASTVFLLVDLGLTLSLWKVGLATLIFSFLWIGFLVDKFTK